MNKLINFQKLLAGSLKLGETYDDPNHPFVKLLLVYFLILLIVSIEGQAGQFIFIILSYCLVNIYYIVNSSNKLYEIPPVSRPYTVLNIYLFALVTIISFCIIVLLGYLITEVSFSKFYILYNFMSYLKGIVLSLFLFLIISSVYIPTFFIKPLSIRRMLILLETIFFKILLLVSNNSLGNSNGKSFLERISVLRDYNRVLFIAVIIFIVITPISMLISYRLYGKKEILC